MPSIETIQSTERWLAQKQQDIGFGCCPFYDNIYYVSDFSSLFFVVSFSFVGVLFCVPLIVRERKLFHLFSDLAL